MSHVCIVNAAQVQAAHIAADSLETNVSQKWLQSQDSRRRLLSIFSGISDWGVRTTLLASLALNR